MENQAEGPTAPSGSPESRLEQDCEDLAAELEKLQMSLNKARQHPVVVGDSDPLVVAYGTKEKHLKAEIEVRNITESSINPEVFTEEVMLYETKESVTQLQQVLKCLKTQYADLQDQTSTHKSIASKQDEINAALKHQLEVASDQDLAPREASVLARLKDKNNKAVAYSRKLLREMGAFVEEHFAAPTEEEISNYKRKRGRNCGDTVIPLKSIIENLLNRSLESIHDPYITLDDTYWPPYVELLLRTGICQRHTADINQIKLTPFHL